MHSPWIVKHRPKTRVGIVGNRESVNQVVEWVKSWQKGPPKKRALLLHGPPGVGKTVTVEAITRELGYDLVEINASDERNREAIQRIAGMASQQAELFGRKRMILLDEVDGINLSEDKGAIDTILSVIAETRVPIILTANDAWEPKIARLRAACTLVQYKRLGLRDSIPYLKKIAQSEGVAMQEDVLRLVIDRNNGDMRGILNDLQALSSGRTQLSLEEASWLGYRDRKESIFDALGTVFYAKDARTARRAVDQSDVDFEMLFEWVYENAPRQLSDPEDAANAMEALAKADLYMARIRKTQNWSLLPFFFNHMTAGVALSRQRTKPAWTPNRFPSRIQHMGRTRKYRAVRNAIAAAIAARAHVSSRKALRLYMPYLRVIFESNPDRATKIAEWLGLEEEATAFLASGKLTAEPPEDE
jgi:replication factor C large subunit